VSFSDDVTAFKAGHPVKVSANEVSLGPSKSKYWRDQKVVAFDKEGNRMKCAVARIFSESGPLRV
jgi:hypothetical protein